MIIIIIPSDIILSKSSSSSYNSIEMRKNLEAIIDVQTNKYKRQLATMMKKNISYTKKGNKDVSYESGSDKKVINHGLYSSNLKNFLDDVKS